MKFNIDEIIKLYYLGYSLCKIAKIVGASHKTISNYLKTYNIRKPIIGLKKRKDIDTNNIIKLYKEGKSTKDISKILDCSVYLILKRIQTANFKVKKYRDKLTHDFFDIPNYINYYWAGFIAADGWVYKNTLGLEIKDGQHLEILYKLLNAKTKINIRKKYYCFRITSTKIIKDLENNFNITCKKSLTLLPPNNLDKDLINHFIRGYIDGDGCFVKTYKLISILGTKEFLEWINNIFYINCSIKGNIYKKNNIYSLNIYSKSCIKIINWLYTDSTPEVRLDRKYEIASKYLRGSI